MGSNLPIAKSLKGHVRRLRALLRQHGQERPLPRVRLGRLSDVAAEGGARSSRLEPVVIAAALLGVALVTWIVTLERMHGMDAGPGTDLGGLGWFVGIWVTMMAAMMLPSAAPMVMLFARVSQERARRGPAVLVPTWLFIAGYLAAWTAYGLAAYGLFRPSSRPAPPGCALGRQGRSSPGSALLAAGLYQLTPLKSVCLRHCRTPLHFVMHGWRRGGSGAADGHRARRVLPRLLLRPDAGAVRARRDEPLLDGARRRRDLRREGAALRPAADAALAVALVALGIGSRPRPQACPASCSRTRRSAELARMKMMGMEPQAPGMKMQPTPKQMPTTPPPPKAMPMKPKQVPSHVQWRPSRRQ